MSVSPGTAPEDPLPERFLRRSWNRHRHLHAL
jgi:hypothetical protein